MKAKKYRVGVMDDGKTTEIITEIYIPELKVFINKNAGVVPLIGYDCDRSTFAEEGTVEEIEIPDAYCNLIQIVAKAKLLDPFIITSLGVNDATTVEK